MLGIDGSLNTRTEGLRKRIDINGERQERLEDRVDASSSGWARSTRRWTQMASLNSLSSYVTQQIAAMTNSSKND